MKKRKLLSALVIGALVGTLTMTPSNTAKAQTDIYINNSGGGTNTYRYGYANNDYLYASDSSGVSPSSYDKRYEYWAGHDDWNDRLFMSGGNLTTVGDHNAYIYASGGNLNVNDGTLYLYYDSDDGFSHSYIGSSVNLYIDSDATVNMYSSGSSITLNEGDSIYGKIIASGGTLTVSGGDHNLGASTIGSAVDFAVTNGATVRFNSANNIGTNFNNAGTVYLNGGTLSKNITNSGSGNIYFNGANNSGSVSGGTNHNAIVTGSSTNSGTISVKGFYVGETATGTGNFINNGTVTTGSNLTVRSNSTFTNNNGHALNIGGSLYTNSGATTTIANADNVTLAGSYVNNGALVFKNGTIGKNVTGTGSTEVNTGDVTNNAAINQALNVTSGTFDNAAGGSVTGLTTVSSGATVNNTAGTLANVTNSGTLNVSGGSASAVTNNKTLSISGGTVASVDNANSTNSVATQTGGNVTNDVNNVGSYTISGGSIGGTVTNTGTLSISTTGTVGGVTNSASGTLGASQSKGTVTTLSNSGKYTQTGGTVTTANNTGTYNLSGTGSTVTNYSQSGSSSSLTVDGGASLTITDSTNGITGETNAITGGEVKLGSSTTSLGNLTIANGTTNTAKVTTTGGSGLNIQNGTLTTSTGTDIGNGAAVTIGTASGTTGTLNVTNGTVALGTNDNWNAKGTVNVNGGTLNLNGVTQTGALSQTSGTTNIASAQTLGTGASVTGGTLNVDNNLTLTDGTIKAGDGFALVSIDSGKTLDIQGGTVTLDGGSGTHGQVDWNGTVHLNGTNANLILSNIYDASRTTTETKNKTGILNAETGNLTINSSTVLLGNNDIIADAVNLTLAGNIVVDSGANAYIGSTDTWTVGNVTQTGGTLSLDGVSTAAGKTLDSNGGVLNVINTVTLATGADTIATGTTVNIASGNTLDIDNTATAGVTLDSGDNWGGNIKLDGGNLTLTGRTDSTGTSQTYNQTGGTLKLTSDSLTLNAGSAITGGTVNIDPSTLIFDNGVDNSATVLMTDGASVLTIKGIDSTNITTLTLLTGSDIDEGTVTVGDGTNANVLNIYNDSDIAGDVVFKVLDKATANVAGTSNLVINGTGTSADVWNGTINQTAGTITFIDNIVKDATTAKLTSNGGNIIVGYVDTLDPTNNQAGTLTLNNANDSVTSATAVTINTNGTLVQSAGKVVLDNTNDNWNGAIELSGTGDLTLSGRSDTTTATKTFNQSAGKLTINNGGSLTLNTAASKINGTGEVVLGDTTNTAGTLVVNNGSANQAKVTTAGTSTSNAFSVTGANTAFTTLTGTDFEVGSVTVGNGTDASVLNLSNNGIIADAVALTVAKASTMNIDGASAQATINTGDVWNGQINQTNGTLTVLNDDYTKSSTTGYLTSNGGNIVIGDVTSATPVPGTLILNNTLDDIKTATAVTINTNGTLAQSAGTVVLDNTNDIWNGAIALSGTGDLTLSGRTDATDAATPNPKTYNQTGGTLNLEASSLDLATSNSKITSGNVNINNASTLTLENASANTAKVVMSDGTASTLNILGANSQLTTSTGTNLATGTVNLGDATNTSKLNLANNSIIAQAAVLNIASASELNISGTASAIIDNATDTYLGDVNMSAGTLEMRDMTLTTGVTPTAAGGTEPYYSQTGGALTLTNTTLSMASAGEITGGDLTVDTNSTFNSLSNAFSVANLTNAGLINGINGGYENYAASTSFSAGDTLGDNQGDFTVDLFAREGAYKNYDSFGSTSADILAENGTDAVFKVSDWTLNGDIFGWDAPVDRSFSMDNLFKGSVATAVSLGQTINFAATDKAVFTPIGWYKLNSVAGAPGSYSFDLASYNPGVFRGQVSTIAQYQNQLMIDDILFSHTMLDNGFKGNDYIVSNPNRLASASDLYPPYQYSRKDGGVWVKGYGAFENLNMNQGLNIGNNAYGTLIGVDFGLKELKRGWQFMPTAYIGYNGAHQYWNGYGSYQNGGQLGVMGTWYKNNFMIGALAYGGVYGNEMSTPRGNDNTFNYFAGSSVKAAYNWRFAKDWSLQPNLMVAYNFFGSQNWHTDFGQMGMMAGMLNGINIAPGLNLIWEKETFSIYATLQYMYNINQSSSGRAGNVDLPNIRMDRGYIQYGIGANKRFSDRFSGFLQVVVRNVGRTGIGLQGGFQWQFGKGGSNDRVKKGNVTPALKKADITVKGNKVQ